MRRFWVGIVVIATLLAIAGPAWARAEKIDVEVLDYACEWIPGKTWITPGGILHIRGEVYHTLIFSEDPRLQGTTVVEANWNLNLATGDYFTFGNITFQPEGVGGTWDGHWSSHFRDGVISASLVAQGTGALHGLQLKMDIQVLGEVPEPNPCGSAPYYVARSTGHILDPHGD
jgi:hypothetical protein